MAEQDDNLRLNRIEQKLDKVAEAIISLARMEERMITLFKRMDSYDDAQKKLEERVTTVEVSHATAKGSSSWSDKIVWLIVAALISGALVVGK